MRKQRYSPWYIAALLSALIFFTEMMHADSIISGNNEPESNNWHCSLAEVNLHDQLKVLPGVRHNVGVQCSQNK